MTLPKHNNPTTHNAASAPYNFIPLPDVVIKAVENADELLDHDCYVDGRYTGRFEVTLTTKTPLYIRGMLTETEYIRQENRQYLDGEPIPNASRNVDFRRLPKNKPDFFAIQEKPVIPGSSLRGMLRSLVEIITYSKMKWVTDKPIIYRAVGDPTAVGNSYREKVMGKNKTTEPDVHYDYPVRQLKGGYLRQTATGWAIQPAQPLKGETFVRVNYADVEPIIGGRNRQLIHKVYVEPAIRNSSSRGQRGPGNLTLDVAVTSHVSDTPAPSLVPARLIESGHMRGNHAKHWHCAIYEPDTNVSLINIPDALWQIYQEDRDMTRGFKTRKLTYDGNPLFYLLNSKNELVFFGPTVMFRLPYHEHALDLVPLNLRNPNEIDYTEAMFGFIRTQKEVSQMATKPKQGSKELAYAGRVFVTNGRYQPNQGVPWITDAPNGIIEPHILASPKPTSFQHYLTQDTPNNRKTLYHYDSNTDKGKQATTLRGFKLYWAQGKKSASDLQAKPKDERDKKRAFEEAPDGKLRPKWNSTQHTRMRPVDSNKKFTFHVYFENLTDMELGVLQWALTVPDCHRLGMGKPLGMGVIQLEKSVLHLNSRTNRYETLLSNSNAWNAGKPETKQDFTTDFETAIVTKLRKGSPLQANNFQQIERIQMLLTMLSWPGPDAEQTCYMEINRPTGRFLHDGKPETINEYKERPVLPDPLNLGGAEADDLPEVREEVSDFAKLFQQKLEQKQGNSNE